MPFFKKNPAVPPIADAPATPARPPSDLPDSTNLSGTCTRRGFKSSFANSATFGVTSAGFLAELAGDRARLDVERAVILQCRHCEQSLVVLEELLIGGKKWHTAAKGGTNEWRAIFWWPLPDTKLGDDVPVSVREAFAEATLCQAAGCHRAAAAMARRTLEAICADRSALGKTLSESVRILISDGHLGAAMAEWATEVRLIGNRGAHFDLIEPVEADDVARLLRFLTELTKLVYVLPAELTRSRRSPQ